MTDILKFNTQKGNSTDKLLHRKDYDMSTLLRHPLLQAVNDLKRAFVLNEFVLLDHSMHPEIEKEDFSVPLFMEPEDASLPPIPLLENGSYALRTRLLPGRLSSIPKGAPLRAVTCGKVFDASDKEHPEHMRLEGIVAQPDLRINSYTLIWDRIAEGTLGIGSRAKLEQIGKKTYQIKIIDRAGIIYQLGWTGEAKWLTSEYLGTNQPGIKTWVFIIDADTFAMQLHTIDNRHSLYTSDVSALSAYRSNEMSVGNTIEERASDVLRSLGYTEFIGPTIYEAGAYKKMNMFQDEWDKNNKGVPLTWKTSEQDALRTVLAPSLEDALAKNFKAGNKDVRIFETGHIFLPKGRHDKDKTPYEKLSLSVGAYGPEMDYETFTQEVKKILDGLGVKIHYFVETEAAIAYYAKECSLIMSRMGGYLFGNFGQISPKAQRNYGIGVPAYMAQFELEPLEMDALSELQKNPEEIA